MVLLPPTQNFTHPHRADMEGVQYGGSTSPTTSLPLYWFPVAHRTNYHKCAGLKQQECILSQFWSLKSKTKVLARLVLSGSSGPLSWLLVAPTVPASSLCLHLHMASSLSLCLPTVLQGHLSLD